MDIPNNQIVRSEKSYTIVSDKKHSFSLKIVDLDSSIELSASSQEFQNQYFYKNNFDLSTLGKINRFFLLYDSINDIYKDLLLYLDINQTKIIEEANKIKIIIPIENIRIKEIIFELLKSEKNDNDKFKGILLTLSDLRKEINMLKEENKMIKEENKSLKEKLEGFMIYIPYLEKYKKKCEDKNNFLYNLDSLIIEDNESYNTTLKNWINPKLRIKSELLYRLTRDGEEYKTFHKLCDYKGPTIILTKLTDGTILGSYTPLDWDSKSCWKSDTNMFVFSLTENKRAMKKETSKNFGIFCDKDYGPETYFLSFTRGHKMNEPQIRLEIPEYTIDTQILVPGKNHYSFYKADEVEVHKIIIG